VVTFYKGLRGSTAHHATGVPGSLDALAWQYALLNFSIALCGVCTIANNAAIISQARMPRRACRGAHAPEAVSPVPAPPAPARAGGPTGGGGAQALTYTLSPQVVPTRLRSSAYAFDGCISGAFGAAAAPIVGLIAAAGGFSQRVAQVRRGDVCALCASPPCCGAPTWHAQAGSAGPGRLCGATPGSMGLRAGHHAY